MRLLLIVLLAAGMCAAFSVRPAYDGVQDTGHPGLPGLRVDIALDCGSKVMTVAVSSNDSGEPVENASLYLFYTDYVYQLVASGRTGPDGVGWITPVGRRNYLTDMFILRTDHQQFRSREVEFAYRKCFDAPLPDGFNATNQTLNNGQNTTKPQNTSQPANQTAQKNQTNQAQAGNTTAGNGTAAGNGHENPGQPAPCLPALALIPLAQLALLAGGMKTHLGYFSANPP